MKEYGVCLASEVEGAAAEAAATEAAAAALLSQLTIDDDSDDAMLTMKIRLVTPSASPHCLV
jgi:hypothetical protein